MEQSSVTKIGICIGCNKRAVLEDDICQDCRDSPSRGLKWAKLAGRIRNDPDLALHVYSRIKTREAKKVFLFLFQDSLEKNGVDMRFIEAQVNSAK